MTIKVCRSKTFKALAKIGKICSKLFQLFVLIWVPFGIYFIMTNDSSFGVLGVIFGVLGTFIFIPLLRSADGFIDFNETILHDINNKIKLFQWNEDC